MKVNHTSALVLVAAFAFSGCMHRAKDQKPEVSPEQAARAERQDSAGKVSKSLQQFNDSRTVYTQNAEKTLNELDAKAATLKTKLPDDPAKRDAQAQIIEDAQAKIADARSQLDTLKSTSSDQWSQQQNALEQSITGAESQLTQASSVVAH